MAQIEWYMYLAATTLYIVSSVFYIYCLVFKNEEKLRYAFGTALAGLVFHSVSIALRWVETGHGPYISLYEVLSQAAWISVAFFLLTQKKYERIRIAGFVVMPVSFLLMGVGATNLRDFTTIPVSLHSYWLAPHAGFATLAFGCILTATGIAALYILKERYENINKDPEVDSFFKKVPALKVMDELMYRFVGLGLIFLTIMIATGGIWANQTWGRYWAWDPIENWSLISWFMYAACLHMRVNAGWTGKRFAWFIILSIFVLAFSLFGVGVVYTGLHTDYITA
jgi:cytochrome c-type biogenesis protein CcsB